MHKFAAPAHSLLLSVILLMSILPWQALAANGSESASPGKSSQQKPGRSSDYRLPAAVVPEKYELEFIPDPANGSFSGKADIELKVKQESQDILLNAKEITCSSAKLFPESPEARTYPLQVQEEKSLERLRLHSSSKIPAGSYHLRLEFKGILNDKLTGFYRSTYKDKQGKTHYLAVTQMEPTDARRMFPCFDEPAYKAVFKIRVITSNENTAISNAPVESERIDKNSGKKIIDFAATQAMSSYLVALLVGEFKATEAADCNGVPVRVWTCRPDISMGNYARNNAVKLLKYLNSYFRIDYPWKKLDLIAIPDFEAGAMENPGAITFREKFLLVDEKASSLWTRQNTVSIIAHELAHQWFGDLVTMNWWDDLWLNEAFATWMADKAVDNVQPSWQALTQFYSDRLRALFTDSLHSTRAIQAPVKNPDDALQMFDEITYVKGASVLRMLEYFLGEKTFQDGVSNYLKEHSFANAGTDDLWAALAKVSGKPVKKIMDSWCAQPGYPLVNIKANGKSSIEVKQERFFLDGGKSGAQNWSLPLGLRPLEASSGLAYELCSLASQALKIDFAKKAFCANAFAYGFYRSNYDDETTSKLSESLNLLSPEERLCFLSDRAALCFAGKSPVAQYLKVLKAYRNEDNFAVWDCILDCFNKLNRFVKPENRKHFAALVRYVLGPEFKRLGWEEKAGEQEPLRLLRGQLILTLGTIGEDRAVITAASKKLAEYMQSAGKVSPDLLDAIAGIVAYNGNAADFEKLRKLWKNAATPEVEQRNLFALASFRQPELVQKALELTVSKEVRNQDAPKLLARFFENDDNKQAAWNFMKSHWAQIKQIYSPGMLAKLAEAPQSLSSEKNYLDVQSFFEKNKIPEGKSRVARMLEKLKINVQFSQRSAASFNSWLAQNAALLK